MRISKKIITAIVSILVVFGLVSSKDANTILKLLNNATQSSSNTSGDYSSSSTSDTTQVSVTDYSNTIATIGEVDIPQYTGEASYVVNDGEPYFLKEELTNVTYVTFSSLDSLERQGVADAVLGPETLQDHERGSISQYHPSGWWEAKQTDVNVNRCHLIGNQLGGDQTDCLENLVTGSRYMNVEGQLPYENEVDDYIESTANHVRYRVTPIFEGNDVTCKGVLMEAYSIEDNGAGIKFCVYCYNVQPGYVCDYSIGLWEKIISE